MLLGLLFRTENKKKYNNNNNNNRRKKILRHQLTNPLPNMQSDKYKYYLAKSLLFSDIIKFRK